MSDRKYHVTYSLAHHPDGLTKEQIRAISPDTGGADAVLIISIIGEHGKFEPYSIGPLSIRGSTGKPLASGELFHIWAMLARTLADDETLGEGPRDIATFAFEALRGHILTRRART